MTNKEFLNHHVLEMPVFEDEIEKVETILHEANEHFVLFYKRPAEPDTECFMNKKRYIYSIHCDKTNFAQAYFYLGRKMAPIINSRS